MKLGIIIPVYNEEKTIKKVIEKVLDVNFPYKTKIIIINDGSTDKTLKEINKLSQKFNLITYNKNRGKGYAVRQGLNNSNADIYIIQDSDLEYDPSQIPMLLQPIFKKKADVVYGSRFNYPGANNWVLPLHYLGNKFLAFFTFILYRRKFVDIETCYKVFTNEVKESLNLETNDFGFEAEFTAKVCKNGYRITEIPIRYKPRLKKDGKKINWTDGIKAIYYLTKYSLN